MMSKPKLRLFQLLPVETHEIEVVSFRVALRSTTRAPNDVHLVSLLKVSVAALCPPGSGCLVLDATFSRCHYLSAVTSLDLLQGCPVSSFPWAAIPLLRASHERPRAGRGQSQAVRVSVQQVGPLPSAPAVNHSILLARLPRDTAALANTWLQGHSSGHSR